MLLDILHSDAVNSLDCRTVLEAVAGQLTECNIASRFVFGALSTWHIANHRFVS
jgi:hypothetical protein